MNVLQHITWITVTLLLAMLLFSAHASYSFARSEYEDVKHILSLSAKVLACSIDDGPASMEKLSQGYLNDGRGGFDIDLDKLSREFCGMLYRNCGNQDKYHRINRQIAARVLTLDNRFYIADSLGRWSPPFFYMLNVAGKQIYINIKDYTVWYYGTGGAKQQSDCRKLGIPYEKACEAALSAVNNSVTKYLASSGFIGSLDISSYNPYVADAARRLRQPDFSILDGTTFFVLYADSLVPVSSQKQFIIQNLNTAGYTLQSE